jgi:hypothetical protein
VHVADGVEADVERVEELNEVAIGRERDDAGGVAVKKSRSAEEGKGREGEQNALYRRFKRQPRDLDEVRKGEDREHAVRRLDQEDRAPLLLHHRRLFERRSLVFVLCDLRTVDVVEGSNGVRAYGEPETRQSASSVEVLGRLERMLMRGCELELLRVGFKRAAVLVEDEGGEGVGTRIGVLDGSEGGAQMPASADVGELEDASEAGSLGDEKARRAVEICGKDSQYSEEESDTEGTRKGAAKSAKRRERRTFADGRNRPC